MDMIGTEGIKETVFSLNKTPIPILLNFYKYELNITNYAISLLIKNSAKRITFLRILCQFYEL